MEDCFNYDSVPLNYLHCLNPDCCQFHYIREGDDGYSLSNSSTRCIFQDSFKNIWTGVWGGGINFLSYEPPLFGGYYYSPNQNSMSRLNNKTASSVCVDSQGKLWIGTDGGGINVFLIKVNGYPFTLIKDIDSSPICSNPQFTLAIHTNAACCFIIQATH